MSGRTMSDLPEPNVPDYGKPVSLRELSYLLGWKEPNEKLMLEVLKGDG